MSRAVEQRENDQLVDDTYAAVRRACERVVDACDADPEALPPSVRAALDAYRAAVSALASALVRRDNQARKETSR